MSKEYFDDGCEDCMPVLVNPSTGKSLSLDSLEMKVVMDVWKKTTLDERRAFHDVCCTSSREPTKVEAANALANRITVALHQLTSN